MKQKIFNIHLYFDALKQLRIIGITGTVILTIAAVIMAIGTFLSNQNYPSDSISPDVVNLLNMHMLLVLCFLLIAPLLSLYLFSFMNNRNASDFYHSIPHKRSCLFLSFFAAIVTWLLFIIVFSSLISIIASLFLNDYYILNTASIFSTMFNVFAGSVFVAACVSAAMCITGTLFNNIIVTAMIIFVPRLITSVMLYTVSSSLPLVSTNNFIPFLDVKYNVVTGFLFQAVGLGSSSGALSSLTSFSSGLYTLIAGIVITLCAMLLFVYRKSESAGFSAPNRALQSAFRIILALIVCLIPIYMIFENYASGIELTSQTIFEYAIFYVIAVIVYFVYELITTRKWKNLLRAVPGLIILALLNLAVAGGMLGIFRNVINFTPDASEIKSIRLVSDSRNYGYDPMEYFNHATEKIEITNSTINEIVSKSLASASEKIDVSLADYRNEFYNSTTRTVAIRTGNRIHYRNIILSEKDSDQIASELAKIEEYKNIYSQLPEIGVNHTSVTLANNQKIPSSSVEKIYDALREDFADMDFQDLYHLINQPNYEPAGSLDTLVLTSTLGLNISSAEIVISPLYKKAASVYIQESTKFINTQEERLLSIFESSDKKDLSIELIPLNFEENLDGNYYSVNDLSQLDRDLLNDMAAFISSPSDHLPDMNAPLLRISIWAYDYEDYTSDNYYFYRQIGTETEKEMITSFLEEIK